MFKDYNFQNFECLMIRIFKLRMFNDKIFQYFKMFSDKNF